MNKSTKDKIIEEATELFADNGFDGASVRLIAQKAGVNLAAINYHFSNKQNLYYEVLRSGFNQFTEQLKKIASKSKSTTDFSVNLYRAWIKNGPRLINNFKVLLTNLPMPDDLIKKDNAGPPGAEYIQERLEQELGFKLKEEDALWASRVIFTYVTHTALMASTHFGKQNCCDAFAQKSVEKSIDRLIRSVVNELKSTR